ncbi:MAG: hypothetical protein H7039_19575 [Bryobacteraceae bacterium]|nr:hypothetical protein [Bryobacteraceae bacterium]
MAATALIFLLGLFLLINAVLMLADPQKWVNVWNRIFRLTMGGRVWFQFSDDYMQDRVNRLGTRLAGVVMLCFAWVFLSAAAFSMARLANQDSTLPVDPTLATPGRPGGG